MSFAHSDTEAVIKSSIIDTLHCVLFIINFLNGIVFLFIIIFIVVVG